MIKSGKSISFGPRTSFLKNGLMRTIFSTNSHTKSCFEKSLYMNNCVCVHSKGCNLSDTLMKFSTPAHFGPSTERLVQIGPLFQSLRFILKSRHMNICRVVLGIERWSTIGPYFFSIFYVPICISDALDRKSL